MPVCAKSAGGAPLLAGLAWQRNAWLWALGAASKATLPPRKLMCRFVPGVELHHACTLVPIPTLLPIFSLPHLHL